MIPHWAIVMLDQVAKDNGRSKLPKLFWRNGNRRQTSGCYNPWTNRISITAGQEDVEQVFLHEICHWLTKPRGKKRSWHGKRFYKKLHDLLERYNMNTEQYKSREAVYMRRSVNYL